MEWIFLKSGNNEPTTKCSKMTPDQMITVF